MTNKVVTIKIKVFDDCFFNSIKSIPAFLKIIKLIYKG